MRTWENRRNPNVAGTSWFTSKKQIAAKATPRTHRVRRDARKVPQFAGKSIGSHSLRGPRRIEGLATLHAAGSKDSPVHRLSPTRQKTLGICLLRARLDMAMISNVRTLDRRLLTRRCVSCGYDGASVSRMQTVRCPRCACDLLQRPPRSYAEMEGLLGRPIVEVDMEAA